MKYIQYLWMCCIGLCLFACTEADELKTTEGKTGFLVSLKEETVGVEARTIPKDLPAPMKTDFTIRILNARTCEEVKNVQCTGDNQLIDVGVGIYNVVAEYGDGSAVSLDAPYYKGVVENQRVNDGKATLVTVNCKVANALLSISYDESNLKFTDVYEEGYYIKVVANGKPVVIKDIEKSAYFPAGASFDVYFCAVKKGETEEKEIKLNVEYNTLNPADHLTLFLSPEPEKYEVPLSITKMEIQQVSINETIPMGWLPKPKVTATGFDSNNTLAFVETEQKQAALNLNLSSALQDIKFKFDFQDEQFASSLQKDKEYLLSNAEDKQAMETALGITLPSVGDKPESIDLSGLVAKLQTNAGEPTTNTIEVDVQANNRWSSEDTEANRTYTITCNKPEFSIAVRPENCWSREFTIDEVMVSGNADVEKIKVNLVYQYYNGSEWVNCTTRDNVQGRTQQFADAAENIATKTYKVRALYRGAIPSAEVEATLETPMQLPNSGMEEWYEEDQSDHHNLWFPYARGANGSQWTTNNSETTNYRSESYCSTSGVKKSTSIIYSGTAAAWIRTVGHGIANTNVGSFWGINGSVTGTGTIGVLSYSDEFAVRPTQVSFYYRYIQKGDDAGVVRLKIENKDQNVVLFETNITVQNTDYIKRDIPITYSIENVCATHITLTFESGSKHTEVVKAKVRGHNADGTEADEHYGSEFYVDDISLIYDK